MRPHELVLVTLLIAIVTAGVSIATLWMLNTLFMLELDYNFETVMAAAILALLVGGNYVRRK